MRRTKRGEQNTKVS